jgi:hypothetical protein
MFQTENSVVAPKGDLAKPTGAAKPVDGKTERAKGAAVKPEAKKGGAEKRTPAKRPMGAEHKASLIAGRARAATVRRYLELLEGSKTKARGGSAESIERRLTQIDQQLASAPPLKRLQLLQEQDDARRHLASLAGEAQLGQAEADFVAVAREYARQKRIGYKAWRSVGVPAAVLKRAGITK